MFMVSTACVIGAHTVSSQRQAALASVYAVTDQALRAYKKNVAEQLTPAQSDGIRTSVAEERMSGSVEPVTILEMGDTNLYFDMFSARYFMAGTLEDMRKIANDLNERLFSEMFISVNDVYYELGLDYVGQGDNIGWELGRNKVVFEFGSKLTPKGRSCIVIDYEVQPRYVKE